MKSLEFFKPTLATTLAIVLASLLSVRPAQAGYTVTLQQVGPDVVATGGGAIDLHGLRFDFSDSYVNPGIFPTIITYPWISGGASIFTGPNSSSVDSYSGGTGPKALGDGRTYYPYGTVANSGSGDMVCAGTSSLKAQISVPRGYVSGTGLSDSATYSGQTFATLGVTPGTYVWRWGSGANQNFTLQIEPPVTTNITNISTRASVQTGQGVTIVGFAVAGTDSKQVVVRGLGPTLTQYNVPGVLLDPILDLHDSSSSIYTNDNWKETQQAAIQATGLQPPNDLESAILRTLTPGNYTAILAGKNGATGIGLVEVYDVATGALAELTSVSTRGFVGTGEGVLIGGIATSGGFTQVVVRGLGPTLTQFDVTGVLADPTLTLVDANGNELGHNNNWKESQQAAIQVTGLAPPNDLESAIVITLAAGNYTAILEGNGGGTGVGLIEIYKL
jgi:hypothetical protein